MDQREQTKTKCASEWYKGDPVAVWTMKLWVFNSALEANDSLGKVLFKGFPEGKREREEEMHK